MQPIAEFGTLSPFLAPASDNSLGSTDACPRYSSYPSPRHQQAPISKSLQATAIQQATSLSSSSLTPSLGPSLSGEQPRLQSFQAAVSIGTTPSPVPDSCPAFCLTPSTSAAFRSLSLKSPGHSWPVQASQLSPFTPTEQPPRKPASFGSYLSDKRTQQDQIITGSLQSSSPSSQSGKEVSIPAGSQLSISSLAQPTSVAFPANQLLLATPVSVAVSLPPLSSSYNTNLTSVSTMGSRDQVEPSSAGPSATFDRSSMYNFSSGANNHYHVQPSFAGHVESHSHQSDGLAAIVAAATDARHNDPSLANLANATEGSTLPENSVVGVAQVSEEVDYASPVTKQRLFIHPPPYNASRPSLHGAASASASSHPAASATTSTFAAPSITSATSHGTFSTHEPPTPGSAPPHMADFPLVHSRENSQTSQPEHMRITIPSSTGQYGHYHAPPSHAYYAAPQHPGFYAQPPQTAPLPTKDTVYDDGHPPTPATAQPSLHHHYAMMQQRHHQMSTLSAAAAHHAGYSALDCRPANPSAPQLPPPDFSPYSTDYPASPFDARHQPSPAYTIAESSGYAHPLAPIRSFGINRPSSKGSHIEHSPGTALISPMSAHLATPSYPQHPYAALTPMARPINLDEEVKNIEAHSGATSFISKLWFLLSQPQEFGEYIRWTTKGNGFILSHNSPTFGDAILSRFFRHSNIASFVRQLNLYKMQRMSQLALLEDLNDSGGKVEGELTHTGFTHVHLQRGHPETLHLIKPQSGRKRSRKEIRDAALLNDASTSTGSGKKTRTQNQA